MRHVSLSRIASLRLIFYCMGDLNQNDQNDQIVKFFAVDKLWTTIRNMGLQIFASRTLKGTLHYTLSGRFFL
jgi:hypothetical protein